MQLSSLSVFLLVFLTTLFTWPTVSVAGEGASEGFGLFGMGGGPPLQLPEPVPPGMQFSGIPVLAASLSTVPTIQQPPVPVPPPMPDRRPEPPTSHGTLIARGMASWYGGIFHNRLTAIGERFDKDALSAAMRLTKGELGFDARVTDLSNGRSVVVRVNDKGPYAHYRGNFSETGRVIDLSEGAMEALVGSVRRGRSIRPSEGLVKVKVERLTPR